MRRLIAGELRTGWPVVLACFAAAVFAWGFAAFGPAVYLAELQRQYGRSAAMIGSATTVAFIVGAGLVPWAGTAIERLGARVVLTGGLLLIGAGVIGLSQAAAPWQLYAWNLLIGCGWAGASSTAISTTLAGYFDQRLGLALNLGLTGASAGGFAVAPGLVALSHRYSLRIAVPALALTLILVILPLIWIGIRRPGGGPYRRSASGGQGGPLPILATRSAALRNARFWSVAGPFGLAMSALVGMMVYQLSYLLPLIGVAGASVALFCTSASAAVGRLIFSALVDRLDQRPSQRGDLRQPSRGFDPDDRDAKNTDGSLCRQHYFRTVHGQRRRSAVLDHSARIRAFVIWPVARPVDRDRASRLFAEPHPARRRARPDGRLSGGARRLRRAATGGGAAGHSRCYREAAGRGAARKTATKRLMLCNDGVRYTQRAIER
jgi:MFS family permease